MYYLCYIIVDDFKYLEIPITCKLILILLKITYTFLFIYSVLIVEKYIVKNNFENHPYCILLYIYMIPIRALNC